MGLGLCLYTTLMWLTKLDTTYLSFGKYLDMAIVVLPVLMILWAIRQENNSYGVTFVGRMVIAIFVGAVSYLIYDPFLYIYHQYINPEWFNAVLNLKETELRAANVPEDRITEALLKMKETNVAQSGIFRFSSLIPSVVVLPGLIALVSFLFIRRRQK